MAHMFSLDDIVIGDRHTLDHIAIADIFQKRSQYPCILTLNLMIIMIFFIITSLLQSSGGPGHRGHGNSTFLSSCKQYIPNCAYSSRDAYNLTILHFVQIKLPKHETLHPVPHPPVYKN